MFKPLDPILHSELRLAVMSLLLGVEEADFTYIKEQTGATAGNLSVQIDKLTKAGYVEVEKKFVGKRPCTTCRITQKGVEAFDQYVNDLKSYLKPKKK
ncbi:MAG: transcriptional regulator [Bacteroidaceae bacterium]|nr:transcriptional regulator [Bacteroidaceae bacterium]